MSTLLLALVLLTAAGAASGLIRAPLTVPRGGPGDHSDTVSVVIPARNEARVVPTLLQSLSRLDRRPAQVLVVDDGSLDHTGSVARAAGAAVLTLTGPPPGWTGKSWACQQGAGATTGDVLLFLDADTELSPDALEGLLDLLACHGGLVSVQPFHRVLRPYEQLSSYFNVVSLLASGAFTRLAGRHPTAFGPCLITSRADYVRAGGHAAVRGAILDDVELARAYGQAGLPVHCAMGGGSVRMRMYPAGPRQLVEGWTKNFASGASAAAPAPTAAVTAWVAAHHAVAVGAVLAVIGAAAGHHLGASHGPPLLWAIAWVVTAWQLRRVLRRTGSFGWWTWALFPIPLLAFDLVFARSVVHTVLRRSVRWRGRDVRLATRRSATGDT